MLPRSSPASFAALVVLLLMEPAILLAQGAAVQALSQQSASRRENVICGPNAVYALLSAYNITVGDRLIDEFMPAHPAGMSLTEVREALRAQGLPAAIRQCSPAGVAAVATPYIAYLKFEVSGGHYLVVLSQAKGIARVLDPTTGETYTTSVAKLLSASGGYVIVPQVRSPLLPIIALSGTIVVAGALLLLVRCRSRTPSTLVLFGVILMLLPATTARAAMGSPGAEPSSPATESFTHWRNARNSGVNCLWLLLRCAGHRVDYATLVSSAAAEQISLDALGKVSASHGLRLVPVQLTFDELEKSSTPLILFMEPQGLGSGTFVLLVDATRDKVAYVEGAAVRWVQQGRDEFRRLWSGYALAPAPEPGGIAAALRPLSLLTLLGALCCLTRWLLPVKSVCVLAALLLLSLQSPAAAAQSSDPALPEEIRQALTRNAQEIAPLTVSWVHERTRNDNAVQLLQIGGNRSGQSIEAQRLTIQNGMLYSRRERQNGGTDVLEHSFNGAHYFIARPPFAGNLHQPSLTKVDIRSMTARNPAAPWFAAVYFELAGFSIPSTAIELSSRRPVQSRIVKLLAEGARLVSCEQGTDDSLPRTKIEIEVPDPDVLPRADAGPRPVQRARRDAGLSAEQIVQHRTAVNRRLAPPASKRLIFLLDPQGDYALMQYEERKANGSVLLTVHNDDWRQVPERKLWLPHHCRITHYTGDQTLFAHPVTRASIRVQSIDPHPQPPASFTLSYSAPGLKVHEQAADGRRESYEIPASPADLALAIAQARNAGFLRGPGGAMRYWWFFVIIGAALAGAAAILALLAQRRLHRTGGDA